MSGVRACRPSSRVPGRRIAALAAGLAASSGFAGCATYTYNCNVKDACRTAAADAPGVHVVTGRPGRPDAPVPPQR